MTRPADITDVSVIIAAWNADDFIAAAVRSALEQTGVSLEVIVIDDASTDATLETAKAAAAGDPRLVCARLDENVGPSGARNHAFTLANGRFLAILDADDRMLPDRLSRLVAFADATASDIVLDNMTRTDSHGVPTGPFLKGPAAGEARSIDLAEYLDPATAEALGASPGFLKPLFRTECLRRLGVTYDETLRNSEDYYFVATLIAEGARMAYTPTADYLYTVRDGSLSHRLNPELTARIVEAERAFQDAYRNRMTAATRVAARQRLKHVSDSHALECAIAALKARNPVSLAAGLPTRAGSAPHVIGRLASIAATKVMGRSDPAER